MLEALINKPEMKEFCLFIKNFHLNKRAKVIGLDLKENYLRFKFYTELLKIPDKEILNSFLGPQCAEEFKFYASMWDPQRESGLAFGLKVDSLNIVQKYFHIKFEDNLKILMFEKQFLFLKMLKINPFLLKKGISYEITSDLNFYKKFYVYIYDPNLIKIVLGYKKLLSNLDISQIQELEIYATEKTIKINIVNKNDNFKIKQNVWQSIPEKYKKDLQTYSKVLEAEPMYTGFTSEDVLSVYFSFTNKIDNILGV
jgi:hypothetical protein